MSRVRSARSRVQRLLGIDRSIAYTVGARLGVVVGGIVTMVLVAKSLSPAAQGYYFTLYSLVGLQLFFELGLGYVVQQFASHERAFLDWTHLRTLQGSEVAKGRLASLVRFCLVWYGVAAFVLIVTVLPIGWHILSSNSSAEGVVWRGPWVLAVLFTALNLLVTPGLALVEGCGHMAKVAAFRGIQAALVSVSGWLVLLLGLGLYAVPLSSMVGFACTASWVTVRYRRFFIDLFRCRGAASSLSWRREVLPFQWKIAVSSVSGYFIFQFFTPVLFAFQGAAIAGQMGMSLSLLSAVSTTANAWFYTKAPTFGMLVARRDYVSLDALFFVTLRKSLLVVVSLAVAAWLAILALKVTGVPLAARVLGLLPLGLLLANAVANQTVFGMAYYLRAHKREPFLIPSIVGAVILGACVYFLGRYANVTSMLLAYLLVNAGVGPVVGWLIFRSKRSQWHTQMPADGEASP